MASRALAAPRPRRRMQQARGVATRSRILTAAEAVFSAQGFESSAMAEVAAAAGVGVGTLYHHFPDKRTLLLELVDDWGNRDLARTAVEFDAERYLGPHAREAIHEDLSSRYRRLRRDGGFYLVVLELADRQPEVRARLSRIAEVSIERLRQLVLAGQRRGRMRAGVDAHAAAFLIHHAIEMAATRVLVHRVETPAPEQVLEELTDMICHYILENPR